MKFSEEVKQWMDNWVLLFMESIKFEQAVKKGLNAVEILENLDKMIKPQSKELWAKMDFINKLELVENSLSRLSRNNKIKGYRTKGTRLYTITPEHLRRIRPMGHIKKDVDLAFK